MVTRRHVLACGWSLALAGAGSGFLMHDDMGSMDDYQQAVAATRATLRQAPMLRDLIRYATLAASGHNTQPWHFRLEAQQITILPDISRGSSGSTPAMTVR